MLENDVQARTQVADDFGTASLGQVLPVAGQARTGDVSFAQLDFKPGGTLIRMGPNTDFTLTELSSEEDDFFTHLELEAGKLWIILTGGEVDVETDIGTAAVRGSLMGVYYSPTTRILTATCLEGHCSLENPAGRTEFTAGQAVEITGPDQAPSAYRQMTIQEYEDWYIILRDLLIGPRLGDRVWLDLNLNGIQDEGEEGVKGVTVHLYDGTDTLRYTTQTDESGYYSFPYMASGTYYLVFELPADYVFSPQDIGDDDALDSDPDPSTGSTDTFEYSYEEEGLNWDAGIIPVELAPTATPTNTPEPTPTSTPPPFCGCYTSGVKFDVVKYDGNPGWGDCGQASACHSIIGDQLVPSGTTIGTGGSCEMLVTCP